MRLTIGCVAALLVTAQAAFGEEYVIPADFRGETPPRRATRDIAFRAT